MPIATLGVWVDRVYVVMKPDRLEVTLAGPDVFSKVEGKVGLSVVGSEVGIEGRFESILSVMREEVKMHMSQQKEMFPHNILHP